MSQPLPPRLSPPAISTSELLAEPPLISRGFLRILLAGSIGIAGYIGVIVLLDRDAPMARDLPAAAPAAAAPTAEQLARAQVDKEDEIAAAMRAHIAIPGMTGEQVVRSKGLPYWKTGRENLSRMERLAGTQMRWTYRPVNPGKRAGWVMMDRNDVVIASSDTIAGWYDQPMSQAELDALAEDRAPDAFAAIEAEMRADGRLPAK